MKKIVQMFHVEIAENLALVNEEYPRRRNTLGLFVGFYLFFSLRLSSIITSSAARLCYHCQLDAFNLKIIIKP